MIKMSARTLDEMTNSEIILSLIFLKPGERNFRVEDLKRGLSAVSAESPNLSISGDNLDRTFFFWDHYLHGDLDLPHYRLSEEGSNFLQKEFATYSPELKLKLAELAEKVWRY